MLYILCIVAGLVVGSIITKLWIFRKTGYGFFSMTETDDVEYSGDYTIRVRIRDGQPLLDKRQIILKRE